MIPLFLRVMRSCQFATSSGDSKKDIAFEKQTKLFDITRITFEGERKNNKIVLEGDILNIIGDFFEVLGRIETEDQLDHLKLLSENLYYDFYVIWAFHIKKLSKVKKFPNPRTKLQSQNYFRNMKLTSCIGF